MTPAKGRADKLAEQIGARRAQVDRTAHHARETHAAAERIEADRGGVVARDVPLATLRVSPFQPRTRPAPVVVERVRRAVADVGGPAAFAEAFFAPAARAETSAPPPSTVERASDAAAPDAVADAETASDSATAKRFPRGGAYEFAQLVASIARDGVRDPVEVRETPAGLELLTGHRRRAAADVVGLATLPTISRGALSDAEAAAVVLRDNLLREDPQPWEEALGLAHAQTTARAEGRPATVAALGAQFGYSAGRVSELLAVARAFHDETLTGIGGGDRDAGEVAVAALPYKALRRLLEHAGDSADLVRETRAVARLDAPAEAERSAVQHTPRRGGGFTLAVARPVEALSLGDAVALVEMLRAQLKRAESRVRALRAVDSDATSATLAVSASGAADGRAQRRPRRKR